jgi:threonine dehydratase
MADGLLTSLGTLTFPIILEHVDRIITVSEPAISDAMRYLWERMKIIVEPSSAVPLAAIFENPALFGNQRIVVILSGGNADLDHLPWNADQ